MVELSLTCKLLQEDHEAKTSKGQAMAIARALAMLTNEATNLPTKNDDVCRDISEHQGTTIPKFRSASDLITLASRDADTCFVGFV